MLLTPVPAKCNAAFSYIVLRLKYIRGLILKLSQNFPIGLPASVFSADNICKRFGPD